MKMMLRVAAATAITIFLAGCRTGQWEQVSYSTPADHINFSDGGKLKLIPVDKNNQLLTTLVKTVEADFAKNRSVSIDNHKPDYVLAFNLQTEFRADNPEQIKFNTKYVKKNVKTNGGSHDIIQTLKHESNTNANFLIIKIYEVSTLTPLDSLNFVFYDADFKATDAESRRKREDFIKVFRNQVSQSLRNALLCRKREIDTYIPKNASYAAKAVLQHDYNREKIEKYFKNILPADFDKFIKQAESVIIAESWWQKKFGCAESKAREETLSNYYLYSIMLEKNDFSQKNLQDQFTRLLKIMQLTQNDALVTGCSNSLGRIEYKWRLLTNTDIKGE